MRMKPGLTGLLVLVSATALSAHLTVSPLQSKAGAVQKYEMRVHNEAKVAATSVDIEIPDGVTVTGVAKPATGSYTTKTEGQRVTTITWQVEVPTGKYVALSFTAKNPETAKELHWTMHEHLADGSTVDWSDKPGSKQKGSVTTLTAEQER